MKARDTDRLWIVIPVKPFAEGKSRIPLPPADRIALNRRFMSHVVRIARATVPASQIIVVSRDDAALAMAREAGGRALRETGNDLNEALGEAARFAAARGAQALLSVFADLPFATPEDLSAMIAARRDDTLVIAPDGKGSGSNALLMPPSVLAYQHGSNSFWRHARAAADSGMKLSIVSRPGLRRDVDTAEDLATFETSDAVLPFLPHA